MAIKHFEPNSTIIVVSDDQARIVVGMPTRVISIDGLTEDDKMALHNFNGCTIRSEDYMPRFEAAFVNRLLESGDPVQMQELHDDVTAHFGGANEASAAALEYLDYLEMDRTPNEMIRDQVLRILIDCYTDFECWAVKQDDGSITLTKGGRAIREAKFGTEQIKQIS